MTTAAILTICILILAIILFATEIISIDLVAMLVMVAFILFGIITPDEGIAGFGNKATITVIFMFVLSAALIKTGGLQLVTDKLSSIFTRNFTLGMISFMLIIATISAFINNTPVVAIFIPVALQIAKKTGISATKFLIPVTFATVIGGTCTLIGTSTNLVVSGIAEKEGLAEFGMFDLTPAGIVFLLIGIAYTSLLGVKVLPNKKVEKDLSKKFGMWDYLTEIELTEHSSSAGKTIMDSDLVRDFELDIIEVRRDSQKFSMPPGDFMLEAKDILKVSCNVEKIKNLKDKANILISLSIAKTEDDLKNRNTTLVELIITSNSDLEGKNLKEIDFRRRFRAIPLAIKHRDDVIHEHIYDLKLKAGDIILAEVKSHYVKELKKIETEQDSSFILLSEDNIVDVNKRTFFGVIVLTLAIITLAATETVDIMVGAISGVSLLVLFRVINMKEMYEAISWNVVFMLACALCIGTAMSNTGLDKMIAESIIKNLGEWGPYAICSAIYLVTALLTQIMTNNATAALVAPIAIASASSLGANALPFLMAVTFAASASYSTPIGYQTNMMVYNAGQYKFMDFIKIGVPMNFIFWIVATFVIPYFYPFYTK